MTLERDNRLLQRQTYAPFTNTRTQALPTVAAPTAAPPTTARRVVRRATPATLTGVPGRPTRACPLLTDNERPWLCDQSTEPKTPQTTTAAIKNVCFKPTRFIATSLKEHLATNPPILDLLSILRVKRNSQSSDVRSPPREHVSAAYPCVACAGNSRATSVHVQVFGRRDDEAIPGHRRPASEKRQGTKSREVGH